MWTGSDKYRISPSGAWTNQTMMRNRRREHSDLPHGGQTPRSAAGNVVAAFRQKPCGPYPGSKSLRSCGYNDEGAADLNGLSPRIPPISALGDRPSGRFGASRRPLLKEHLGRHVEPLGVIRLLIGNGGKRAQSVQICKPERPVDPGRRGKTGSARQASRARILSPAQKMGRPKPPRGSPHLFSNCTDSTIAIRFF